MDCVPVGAGDGGYAAFLGRMTADKGPREAIEVARLAGVPLKIAAKMREKAEIDYFKAEASPCSAMTWSTSVNWTLPRSTSCWVGRWPC